MPDLSERCPICPGTMIEIVYGHPDADMLSQARRGEIILGGCIIEEGQPTHTCDKCSLSARLINFTPKRLLN